MKTLIVFELKKILKNRVNQIAMVFGFLLVFIGNFLLINNEEYTISDEVKYTGAAAIRKQVELEKALTQTLSEEFLADFMHKYQKSAGGEFDYYLIKPAVNLYTLIAVNNTDWDCEWEWEDLISIKSDYGIAFYDRRMEKIEDYLTQQLLNGNMSESEKDYWNRKVSAVKVPFEWGGTENWRSIFQNITFMYFAVMVVCMCIAPVFAGESYYKTDALILTAKYGRTRLIRAKLAASFIYVFLYMLLCWALGTGIYIYLLGSEGWDLPIQLLDTIIPYKLNMFEAYVLNALVIVAIAAVFAGISLLISAVFNNQIAVLSIDVLVFFGPVFLSDIGFGRIWDSVVSMLPVSVFNLKKVLKVYNSYVIAGHIFSYVEMIFIVYILIAVICTIIAGKVYRKHQVT